MKSRKKKGKDSLLARLLGGGKKKGQKSAARKGKVQPRKKVSGEGTAKARALTRLERSIAEVKQMTKIGEKDPERLARLLAGLLAKEREKQRTEKDAFEKQVWDIVHRSEQGEDDIPDDGSGT